MRLALGSRLGVILSLSSYGFIRSFPRGLGADDLFGVMGVACVSLCSRASAGIVMAALVQEDDLPSHRIARLRRERGLFGMTV